MVSQRVDLSPLALEYAISEEDGVTFLFNTFSPLERSMIGVLAFSPLTLDILGEVQVLTFLMPYSGLSLSTKSCMWHTHVIHVPKNIIIKQHITWIKSLRCDLKVKIMFETLKIQYKKYYEWKETM